MENTWKEIGDAQREPAEELMSSGDQAVCEHTTRRRCSTGNNSGTSMEWIACAAAKVK
jgi:hypothetical protein